MYNYIQCRWIHLWIPLYWHVFVCDMSDLYDCARPNMTLVICEPHMSHMWLWQIHMFWSHMWITCGISTCESHVILLHVDHMWNWNNHMWITCGSHVILLHVDHMWNNHMWFTCDITTCGSHVVHMWYWLFQFHMWITCDSHVVFHMWFFRKGN